MRNKEKGGIWRIENEMRSMLGEKRGIGISANNRTILMEEH